MNQLGSGKYQKTSEGSGLNREFISQLNGALISMGGTDGLGTIASMGSHFIEPQIIGENSHLSKEQVHSNNVTSISANVTEHNKQNTHQSLSQDSMTFVNDETERHQAAECNTT